MLIVILSGVASSYVLYWICLAFTGQPPTFFLERWVMLQYRDLYYSYNINIEFITNHYNQHYHLYFSVPEIRASYLLPICLAPLITFFVCCIFLEDFLEKGGHKRVLSGVVRLPQEKYYSLVKRHNRRNKRFQEGIRIHDKIIISRDSETEHLSAIGTTGAGKTTAILNSIVKQAIERGDKVILFDVKGDYTEALAGLSVTHLLAPWDTRSEKWDIAQDISIKHDAELIASSMIYSEKMMANNEDFFLQQARLVFSTLVKILHYESRLNWENLRKYLTTSKFLTGTRSESGEWEAGLFEKYEEALPALDAIGRDSDQSQATWTTLQNSVGKWLADAALAFEEPRFSITNFIRSKKGGVLILRRDETYEMLSKATCVTAATITIKRALQLPQKDNRIWLIMDELSNFPMIPNLKEALTLGRDRGLRCVISAQDITQLYDIYGKELSHTFINQCNNQIWLRSNDDRNSQIAAESIGTARIQVKNRTKHIKKNMSDSVSTSEKIETIIDKGEFSTLRHSRDIKGGGAEGFIKLSGIPATTKLVWPRKPFKKKAQSRVLAEWIDRPMKQLQFDES